MEDWLRSIGLAERIPAFRENRITQDQLAELTEDDLRELGLTIGERKRFLRALTMDRDGQSPDAGDPRRELVRDSIQAERRPLTIMFVDVIDSTAIGEKLDPEDLMEVIRRYREFAGAAITRFGGHIARFVGDGILAYFCYPVANENDPERAVRAALAISGGIGAIPSLTPAPLRCRIGLATGRVVVSELFTGGAADMRTAIGSTPNLAARLQTLAPPNGIVMSEATYERVRKHFVCRSLGPTELKGFEQTHEPWQVIGEIGRAGMARAGVEKTARQTSFQGREAELDLLRALWHQAARGEDAVVLISGEAGIGKSRLVEQLCERVIVRGERVLHLGATAFDQDSPLRPFIDYIIAEAGVSPSDVPEEMMARISAFLGRSARQEFAAAVIANLVGIRVQDPMIASLLPEQLRERTIATLIDHILGLDGEFPLCVVVEDLHWVDPTSRDLLEALIQRMSGHRVLLVLTIREESAAAWSGRVDAMLRLKRLSSEHVGAMLRSLFGNATVPPELAAHVAGKTDGVPLFVEEVARLLMRRRDHDGNGAALGAPALDDLEKQIPASLDESLMSALDRSGTAKEIAQIAAVVGRLVRRDILAALCGLDERRLNDAINALVAAGILDRDIGTPAESFRFHHALLRDAAYASMVRERRRALHASVAEVLGRLAPDLMTAQPEVLALHLTEAGLVEAASPYWLEAARRGLARSALTEASRILRRGLTALEKLDAAGAAPSASRREMVSRLRLQFSVLLGPVLFSLKGPNAPETQELYATAYALSQQLPEDPAHFPIWWGWWRLESVSEQRTSALLARARAWGDPALLLEAHHCGWASHMNRGAYGLCCEHVEAGLAIYGQGDYRHHVRLYGNHDAKACAHGCRSQVYWMQGRLSCALEEEQASLGWATAMDHLGSEVHARGMALLHRVYRREHAHVLQRADELIALTLAHGLRGDGAAPLIFRGWAIAGLGEPRSGLEVLEEGWSRQQQIATNEDYPVYLCCLADVLTALGRPAEAVERVRRELDGLTRSQLRIWIPELERVLGDAILAADASAIAPARAHYARAEQLAAAQAVPMLGLRIAVSAARLDQRLGAAEQAARRLAEAEARLPEELSPDQAIDLRESRALAAVLGA